MPDKERQVLIRKKKRRRRALSGVYTSLPESSLVSLYKLAEPKGSLPTYYRYPAMAHQQAAIQHMQQICGNAVVQHYLESLPRRDECKSKKKLALPSSSGQLQRQKISRENEPPEVEKKENPKTSPKEPAFNLDRWLSSKEYQMVKGLMGESKLNEYAKSLSKKGGELLVTLIEGIKSPNDMVEKEFHKLIGDLFAKDVQKATLEIMSSPAGQKLQKLILQQAHQQPASVIGMTLTALAFAAASNIDIPTIDIQQKLGKGYELAAKAELGKFQAIALKELKLGISYSSKELEAKIFGTYSGEKKKFSLAMREAAPEMENIKSDADVSSSGELSLDFSMNKFGLKTTYLYGSPKQWMGVWEFRLGGKNYYWAPKVILGPDQKLSFALGNQFTADVYQFYSAIFHTTDETSLSHKLKLDKPFGAKGLNVEASIRYRLNEPKITSAKLSGEYKLLEKAPGHPFPVIYLKFEGAYQAAGIGQPKPDFSGLVVLWGSW
jgi:hypothetical protein